MDALHLAIGPLIYLDESSSQYPSFPTTKNRWLIQAGKEQLQINYSMLTQFQGIFATNMTYQCHVHSTTPF